MTRTSRSASATPSLAAVFAAILAASAWFWTPEYVAYVRTLAPQVDYRVIEGPGHFVHLEKPRELNAAILEFLEKNGLLRG